MYTAIAGLLDGATLEAEAASLDGVDRIVRNWMDGPNGHFITIIIIRDPDGDEWEYDE